MFLVKTLQFTKVNI